MTRDEPRLRVQPGEFALRLSTNALAPLLLAVRDASTTEPDARTVWDEVSERRALNMHRLAEDLESVGGIRAG